MLRRLFFCCFPSDGSLQEPGIENVVTNAVLSLREEAEEYLNPAAAAAAAGAAAAVADARASVPQKQPDPVAAAQSAADAAVQAERAAQEKEDLSGAPAANVSGASSPGSASKTAPGTPPLDTQEPADCSGIFYQARQTAAAAVNAVSETGTEVLGDAQSWADHASATAKSVTTQSRELFSTIEQEKASVQKAKDSAEIAFADAGAQYVHGAENAASSAVAAAESAETAATEAAKAIKSKTAATAGSIEASGTSAALDALSKVESATTTAKVEATQTKASLSSLVSPTDIKAAANAAMRASSVMEHLAQRSVSSMSSVKGKVNENVVAQETMPETDKSADDNTVDGAGSDQTGTEDAPGASDAAGTSGGAKKPKKKPANKKKGSKRKGKGSKSK